MADPLMIVAPIAHGASLRERVEQALSGAIQSGVMPPGQVYSVPTLSKMFEVSATPVREAMINLEKRGFVEILRNKGFRISVMTERDLREIVDVRLMLEPPAIVDAARLFPLDREAEFRTMAQNIVDAAESEDLVAYLAADSAFHLELLRLAGNSRLVGVVAELRQQTRMAGLAEIIGTRELASWAEEHQRLLDLLVAGDGEGARQLLVSHITHILRQWRSPDTAPSYKV